MDSNKTYECLHVMVGDRPVLYVCREDGDLVVACGADDHAQSAEDWKVVHAQHVVDDDASLAEIIELPDGMQAERFTVGGLWTRSPIED